MIYTIPEHDVTSLEKLLSSTKRVIDNKSNKLSKSQSHILKHSDKVLPDIFIEYYSTTNKILNKKLSDVLEIEDLNPITIHTFKYENGAHSLEHRDTNSFNTFVIMLEDDYKGGDFYLNGKLTEFKKRGDVANYVGKESPHEVKPVTEGTRTVLVAWYSDIKGKLI